MWPILNKYHARKVEEIEYEIREEGELGEQEIGCHLAESNFQGFHISRNHHRHDVGIDHAECFICKLRLRVWHCTDVTRRVEGDGDHGGTIGAGEGLLL